MLKGLEVWQRSADPGYDMQVEVDAVTRLAAERGLTRYHLCGFSAGASVALAAALAGSGDVIKSITVVEPATIGDDGWAPIESEWRSTLAGVRGLPVPARTTAFAAMMMRPGLMPPPGRNPVSWDGRMDMLEDMLAHVGFSSSDLASITVPCLVLTGGRSHPRFAALAERMVEVMAGARHVMFSDRSHLSPPMREEPSRVADLLRALWISAGTDR